jgi:hypothetical protein
VLFEASLPGTQKVGCYPMDSLKPKPGNAGQADGQKQQDGDDDDNNIDREGGEGDLFLLPRRIFLLPRSIPLECSLFTPVIYDRRNLTRFI